MGLDFRVLEKVAFSLVVGFAIILLAFIVYAKYPGLIKQIDDAVPTMGDYPLLCLFRETVDCPLRFTGMCCA
ncbi:hypothetical protein [Paraburkholderia rhizosphaerae]|uniref:Uncharacterized protein n=1 Tax=Paraburkholderia rhizosphaerae TaxID=480658 RepID=A0A4R8LTV4_9BURK|nr:hypothetical protein [Paraburkholderia rhizosphaerae]TDY50948.1 hypothetical protein BX592_108185 [Paraburkholderia rhizosphaerae]